MHTHKHKRLHEQTYTNPYQHVDTTITTSHMQMHRQQHTHICTRTNADAYISRLTPILTSTWTQPSLSPTNTAFKSEQTSTLFIIFHSFSVVNLRGSKQNETVMRRKGSMYR